MNLWAGRIARALSIRVIVVSLVFGIAVGVLAGLVRPSLTMPVAWIAAAAAYAVAILNDGQMIHCAACRKRVKLGATTCHHCGYRLT